MIASTVDRAVLREYLDVVWPMSSHRLERHWSHDGQDICGRFIMDGRRIVASVFFRDAEYVLGGARAVVRETFGWATRPGARGSGAGTLAMLALMKEGEPIVSLGGSSDTRVLLPRMGWRPAGAHSRCLLAAAPWSAQPRLALHEEWLSDDEAGESVIASGGAAACIRLPNVALYRRPSTVACLGERAIQCLTVREGNTLRGWFLVRIHRTKRFQDCSRLIGAWVDCRLRNGPQSAATLLARYLAPRGRFVTVGALPRSASQGWLRLPGVLPALIANFSGPLDDTAVWIGYGRGDGVVV